MRRAMTMAMVWVGTVGCGGGSGDVTYHRDVRPIFESQCVSCHQPGGIGPFSMIHDEADWQGGEPAWASLAAASVAEGTMPPWLPADDCHPIENSRAMSDEEKATIAAWAESGFPEGREAEFVAPPAKQEVVETPADLMLTAKVPYTPDVDSPDDYRCFVVDYEADIDRWVEGFTVEPDRVEMVHHVILYRLDPEYAEQVEQWDAEDEGPGYTCFGSPGTWDADTLAGWAPGQVAEFYPEGTARPIKTGSKLVMQVHYNTLNVDAADVPADQTAVALWMMPDGEKPRYDLFSYPLADTRLSIDAGDPKVTEEAFLRVSSIPIPLTAIGVFPHMHQLGKKIRLDLLDADGNETCAFRVPEWDFNWQQGYFFPEDQPLTTDDIEEIRLRCIYDNSAANQPTVNGEQIDPRDVGWGDGSFDEMCLMYLYIQVPQGLLDSAF